jgi:hypothetical protein
MFIMLQQVGGTLFRTQFEFVKSMYQKEVQRNCFAAVNDLCYHTKSFVMCKSRVELLV